MDVKIKINKESREVHLPQYFIGIKGENLQDNLEFYFDEFVDGVAWLEILKEDGTKGYLLMDKIGETYVLPIKSSLLTNTGKLYFNLRITQSEVTGEIPVFKSNMAFLRVLDTIEATSTIPEEYPSWLDTANAKIVEIDNKIAEVDNIDIDAEKVDKTTTITIIKKDGTTKEVEILDGEQGPQGEAGEKGEKGDKPVKGVDYFTAEDKAEMVSDITDDAESEFNENVTAKTKAYNDNAIAKVEEYNTNATNKMNSFNANAQTKLDAHNANASNKLSEYNTNATSKTNSYNNNATLATTEFNNNSETKTAEFDEHVETKTAEFDEHTAEVQDELTDLYSNQLSGTAEGQDIEINDSAKMKFKAVELDGKIEQATTVGKNLYDKNWRDFSAAYLTELEDGWIQFTANNTTSQTKYANFFTEKNNLLKPNTVYTYILEVKDNIGDNPKIDLGETGSLSQFTSEKIIEINNSQNIYSAKMTTKNDFTGLNACGRDFIYIAGNKSYNLKFRVSLIEGEVDINNFVYEQYTGGKPSPNPDYPQEIKTVTGDVEAIAINNENLSELEIGTISSVNGAKSPANNRIRTINPIPYTGQNTIEAIGTNQCIVFCYGASNEYLGRTDNKWNALPYTFNVLVDTEFIHIAFKYSDDRVLTLSDISNVELYSEKQTVILPLGDIQPCGDDTVKDYIGGDIDDWYLNKNWGEQVFNGSETNWEVSGSSFATLPLILPKKPINNNTVGVGISSHYIIDTYNNGFYGNVDCCFGISANTSKINFRNVDISSLEEFKVWLSEHNTKVLYQLETPTRTKITDPALVEALNTLAKFKTFKGKTYITTVTDNLKPVLKVNYYKDLETIINNISNAIVASGEV